VRGSDCYGREAFVDLVWEKLSFGHVVLGASATRATTRVATISTSWSSAGNGTIGF
jgi:hypothetical protein